MSVRGCGHLVPPASRLAHDVGTAVLTDDCAMRVKGALAEAKGALLVAELVGRDAQLGVLEANVEARGGHLARVHVVVGCELGEVVEQGVEARGVRRLGVLRVKA